MTPLFLLSSKLMCQQEKGEELAPMADRAREAILVKAGRVVEEARTMSKDWMACRRRRKQKMVAKVKQGRKVRRASLRRTSPVNQGARV
jgi:hypothetical protein